MSVLKLGQVFLDSGFFRDLRSPAQAVVKLLAGRELGLEPMAAMTGIHVIEGKPALSSHLIASGIKRSGRYDYLVREKSSDRCVIEFFRVAGGKREPIGVESFSMDDAKTAGLAGKGPWRSHPKAMLFARAIGNGYRTHCPDALALQVYAEEHGEAEIGGYGDQPRVQILSDAVDVAPVEPVAPSGSEPKEPAAEAPDKAAVECDGLEADALHMLSQIPGDAMQDDARAKWRAAICAASEKRDVARLKAGKARLAQMVAAQAKEAP
jgi:hypothetical protein